MVSDEDHPETSTVPGMPGSEDNVSGKVQPSSSGTGQRPKRQRLTESQRSILRSVLDDYIAGVLSSQQKQQVAQRTGLAQKKVLKYASCRLHPWPAFSIRCPCMHGKVHPAAGRAEHCGLRRA